jgi:cyclopropane-fatty-acyl-phospholipid synthase
MVHIILNRLKNAWQGPPITIVVGNTTQQLGPGVPQATVTIKNARVLWRLLIFPSLAFGEGYMRGDIMVTGDLMAVLHGFQQSHGLIPGWLSYLRKMQAWRPISIQSGVENAQRHYDIGNDFYKLWLDPSRTYSCAYFPEGTETLEQAQRKKRDLLCRKLRLEPGQSLLEIGCGWGSLMFQAAEQYGVKVTGVTPAKEQAAYIIEQARQRNLSHLVSVQECDWREITGTYDRIVSVGMFEHVGSAQHAEFLQHWRTLLRDDGISLLHTIGRSFVGIQDPWIRKYIFPGGYLPNFDEIIVPATAAGLRMYRAENLRPHYARTLALWAANFKQAQSQVVEMFDEQFARMWWLYLQGCEAGFRWGSLELWQLELYGPAASLPFNRDLQSTTT